MKTQWEQFKEAAEYSWKYEIGWDRLTFLLLFFLAIYALSFVF